MVGTRNIDVFVPLQNRNVMRSRVFITGLSLFSITSVALASYKTLASVSGSKGAMEGSLYVTKGVYRAKKERRGGKTLHVCIVGARAACVDIHRLVHFVGDL